MNTPKQNFLGREEIKFLKISGLTLLVMAALLCFHGLLSWELLFLVAVFPVLFYFFKDRLWLLLVLVLPGLLLGEIFVVPVTPGWGYEARISEVLLLVSFFILVLDRFLNPEEIDIRVDRVAFLLFALLAFSTLTFYYIEDLRFFMVGSKVAFFSFAAYFLALNSFRGGRSVRWFLRMAGLTVFLISVQVFIKFYQMGFSSAFFFERSHIEIPLGPIALVSALLAFLLPIFLALYFSKKVEKESIFYLAIFFLGGLAVFLSLGKAAIFSLGLGLFYLFIQLPEKRITFILTGVVFLSLASVFFRSFFTGLLERVAHTFVSENTQFRVTEYKVGWSIIKDNYLSGVGTGQQLLYYQRILDWDQPQLVNNYFLHALLEWGLIGLALLTSVLASLYKRIRTKFRELSDSEGRVLVHGFAAAFLVVVVNGLAEATIFSLPYAIAFWSVAGVFSNLDDLVNC